MIGRLVIAAALMAGASAAHGAAAGGSTDQAFRLALSAFNAGRFTEAIDIWRVLADHDNDPNSEQGLGFMYHSGLGVPVDNVEAANWFNKAAVQGQPDAQRMLGMLYYYGWGVAQSFQIAYAWCDLAMTNGAAAGDCRGASMERMANAQEIQSAFQLSLTYRHLYGDLR